MNVLNQRLKRILIANRGEIACRVISTARKLGIETVAVYSDADHNALHKNMADQAVYIGPAQASDSYLCVDKIINAALATEAQAIHPGYGFLSENDRFAEACSDNGIAFIGPPAEAIRLMGSKSQAKKLMADAGVPMLPGYHGDIQDDERLQSEAEKIGFPLLVKAAYGGGGKGMKIINQASELQEGLASARREALKGFGNDTLLLERFVTTPRHVEVQIFFDNQGNGVYLFDRDCSLQRRHQKVIEEAPAPGLTDELRTAMGTAAVAAGKAIQYESAGTVEFLLEGEHFYFMEMNTRLQVEHPVTEFITGQDLVEWQLRVAAGESLPLQQEQLTCQGHAIEARIYAEDPANDFLPSSGRIQNLQWPESDHQVRVDTGVCQGDSVSSWYDPMLAKIIASGSNREEAITHLTQAMADYQQAGLTDNRDFLISLLNQESFQQVNLSTTFIDRNLDSLQQATCTAEQLRLALTAAALYRFETEAGPVDRSAASGWQMHGIQASPMLFTVNGRDHRILVQKENNELQLSFADGHCRAEVQWQPSQDNTRQGELRAHNLRLSCRVVPMATQKLKVFLPDTSFIINLPGHSSNQAAADGDSMSAPMNGTISTVMAEPGQEVVKGSALIVVEAMKMEHVILAPRDGIISEVYYQAGDRVEAGAALVAYREADDNAA